MNTSKEKPIRTILVNNNNNKSIAMILYLLSSLVVRTTNGLSSSVLLSLPKRKMSFHINTPGMTRPTRPTATSTSTATARFKPNQPKLRTVSTSITANLRDDTIFDKNNQSLRRQIRVGWLSTHTSPKFRMDAGHSLLTHSSTALFSSSPSSSSPSNQEGSPTTEQNSNNGDDENDDEFYSLRLFIPTDDVMEEVGELLAAISTPPDVLFLDGDLGAGKTTFSRGFIRCKLGSDDDDRGDESKGDEFTPNKDDRIRVTSPTYLLSNTYKYRPNDDDGTDTEESSNEESALREIHHIDLYRLSPNSISVFDPLNLDHVFSNCISLVEWPSRLQSFPELLPPRENRLDIDIKIRPASDERIMTLRCPAPSAKSNEEDDDLQQQQQTWYDRLQFLNEQGLLEDLILCTTT